MGGLQERGNHKHRTMVHERKFGRLPLVIGILDRAEVFLTPEFEWDKLPDVELIVVHGGSGKPGVATGILFQDLVDDAKRSIAQKTFEEADFRPPILFSGRWSRNTPEHRRPQVQNGQRVSQATYMKELACKWGVPECLILTEEQSETTRGSIANTSSLLKRYGLQPQTILFITPHIFPKRYLMLWQHYARDIEFLPVGAFTIQGDDEVAVNQSSSSQQAIRRKDCIRELVKTTITATLIRSKLW